MQMIEGLANIRTSLSQRVHGLPPTHRSPELERHFLAKERGRLEAEIARLERRRRQCRQRLADIDAHLEAMAPSVKPGQSAATRPSEEDVAATRVARMTVEY